MRIPRHLAIIMDGNGRWAELSSLPRIAGHQQGVETAREIIEECRSLGVQYLTLFAFSSENWQRPAAEVDALMGLLVAFLRGEIPNMLANGIRFNVIGEMGRLSADVQRILREAMEKSAGNRQMVLTLALSYGGRDELVRAARTLAHEVQEGRLQPEAIDEGLLDRSLDTAGLPDPDFLIRTSGEMRISNFLLWQLAYAELYFSSVLWPDFHRSELHHALGEFGRRERRFGLTGAQLYGEEIAAGEEKEGKPSNRES